MRRWTLCLIGAAVATGFGIAISVWLLPSEADRLQEARLALIARDYTRAEMLAVKIASRPNSDAWAWMVAGEAAARAGRWRDSLTHYERVTEGPVELRASAAFGRGEVCFQLGRLGRAEQELQAALALDSDLRFAQRRLADLFNLTGRRHAAKPFMEQLLRNSNATLEDLFYLGDVDHVVLLPDAVAATVSQSTADPLVILGAGFQALAENRADDARALFERVLEARPSDLDAQGGLGHALLQTAPHELPRWSNRLSGDADNHAGVLAVLGQIAEREDRTQEAAQWYARAVERAMTSRVAWHRFGLVLSKLGQTVDAELVLEHARQLQQVALWLDDLFENRNHLELIRRVAAQLDALGRPAEAAAWAQHALRISPQEAWAVELIERFRQPARAEGDIARLDVLERILRKLTNDGARPRISKPSASIPASLSDASHLEQPGFPASRIRFVDAATTTGLDFIYRPARDTTPGARIIETTGGGVGVLDYDADGWPDVYFTQGSTQFPVPPDNPDRDRLFRNRDGSVWDDISVAAGLDDERFGQGVACGDFNNDGFVDLYVANYGVNRLYQNQGDGTYSDVTPPSMQDEKVWTSSCVIVDLNRDGWPDLFDATYCHGDDVETRLCQKEGVTRSCSPRAFAAEFDRLWLNTGDGGWLLVADGGLDLQHGYGLGVVAFRTTPDSPLGLFVANDEAANYWLVESKSGSGAVGVPPSGRIVGDSQRRFAEAATPMDVRWENRALLGGLAFDANGQPQACMGVACDDANGDGLPDLFVTNFYHESNTLYVAATPEFYEDRTRIAGLREPSWNMLGFGTQFLDADLDGWPDLLVANGHIDDLSSAGEPFEMPPQCFRNLGGIFRELTTQEAGECFARRALGRGLARLDWNRDGHEDAIIVNQESAAALLTNITESVGQPLVLQFRGTIGARDAIGTIVRIHVGSRVITRQLTAGDGFQASNERQLVIGVGDSKLANRLEIFWPDGSRQDIGSLATGRQYLFLQGRDNAVPLQRLQPDEGPD